MKKLKFYLLGIAFLFMLFLPIPFALAWGVKAIPICIICGYALYKIFKAIWYYQI